MTKGKRVVASVLVGLAVLASPLMAGSAQARTHLTIGFGFGVPVYAPPPVYVAPAPAYVAPPVYSYPPPAYVYSPPAYAYTPPPVAYYPTYPRYYAPGPVYTTPVYW